MNILSEIFYLLQGVVKKFVNLFYIIFIGGLITTVLNNKMNMEVIFVSITFLITTQLIIKIKR